MVARNKLKVQLSNEYSLLKEKMEGGKLSDLEASRFKFLEGELNEIWRLEEIKIR